MGKHNHGRKYLLTLLLAAALVMALCVTAFAEGEKVVNFTGTTAAELNTAIANAEAGTKIVLGADVTDADVVLVATKDIILDLNGHTVTAKSFQTNATLTIMDGTAAAPTVSDDYKVTYAAGALKVSVGVYAAEGGHVILNSGKIESKNNGLIAWGDDTGAAEVKSTVTVEGGYVLAQEFAVTAQGKGATANVNGGVMETIDNAVVAGNGTHTADKKLGGTTINITGGTMIGNIKTGGYVACGVYHPQEGTLNISGGTIYANGGCGVLMRGGKLNMTGGEIIATGDAALQGKVGDSRVVVSPSGIIFDRDANYYDAAQVEVSVSGNASVSGTKSAIEVIDTKSAGAADQINVTGGTYSSDVSDYVAPGNKSEQKDGKFVVGINTETAVADVNGVGYATLEEAIAKANSGDTVKLLKDVTVANVIGIKKDLTLDLGGKTVTASSNFAFYLLSGNVTIKNGTVNGRVDDYDTATLTIANDATVNGFVFVNGTGVYGTDGCKTPTLHVYGKIINANTDTNVATQAISTNGNDYSQPVINIYEGAEITSLAGTAMYLPNVGTVTVAGGTITGPSSAIAIKCGTLNITGGTLIATGPDDTPTEGWSNGIYASGAAIQIESNEDYKLNSTTKGAVKINITGGTIKSENGVAIYEYIGKGADTQLDALTISGGTFSAASGKSCFMVSEELGNKENAIQVSGGTFSSEVPEAYCAENFHPQKNSEGNYGVHQHEYEEVIDKAASCKEAGSKHEECKICHDKKAPVEIPMTAHTFAWETVKEATHTEKGSKQEVCSVCGAKGATEEIPAGEHTFGEDWKSDAENHWHECECGETSDSAAHTFQWVTDKKATATEKGSKHEECTVCGYAKAAVEIPVTESPNTGDNTNVVLMSGVMAASLLGIALMAVLLRKKEYEGKYTR